MTRDLQCAFPARLRAGDALSFSVLTGLATGNSVFFTLTAVVNGAPVRLTVGGAGVAVDSSGAAAFSVPSTTTKTWSPGRYQWVAFAVDGSGDRTELAQGVVRIEPDVAGTSAVDPRSFNEKMLDQIRAVRLGKALDDVAMYKIGGRELTKVPHADLARLEAEFETRVRNERIRRGERVPRKTRGIRFGA